MPEHPRPPAVTWHPSVIAPEEAALDHWVRTRMVAINRVLESRYAELPDRQAVDVRDATVASTLQHVPASLVREIVELQDGLLAEGEALAAELDVGRILGQPDDYVFSVLGNLGFVMASCRRHRITAGFTGSTAYVATQLGMQMEMVPRLVAAHLELHNGATEDGYRTFTGHPEEHHFLFGNSRAALSYMRAARALLQARQVGIHHPLATVMFDEAAHDLRQAQASQEELHQKLDVERFFYEVRPYFKPHPVLDTVYRGPNGGDIASINVIDVVLGLCDTDDPEYLRLTRDKVRYLVPAERLWLREVWNQLDTGRSQTVLDAFLATDPDDARLLPQLDAFLRVCDLHGQATAFHHSHLISRFISAPAANLPPDHLDDLTGAGPPLDVLLRSLERVRDLRTAAVRDDIPSRHADLASLRRRLVD